MFLDDRNEEMQSIRALTPTEVQEKVLKAKYIHKFYYEFAEAVRAGALAISEGHIAPMVRAYMYVYVFID
jgi:hypothetical protein